MKVHLLRLTSKRHVFLDKGERKSLCGVQDPPSVAIGPEAVTCATCRSSEAFVYYNAGWRVRDKQKD